MIMRNHEMESPVLIQVQGLALLRTYHTCSVQVLVSNQDYSFTHLQKLAHRQQRIVCLQNHLAGIKRPNPIAELQGRWEVIADLLSDPGAKACSRASSEALQQQEATQVVTPLNLTSGTLYNSLCTSGSVVIVSQCPVVAYVER